MPMTAKKSKSRCVFTKYWALKNSNVLCIKNMGRILSIEERIRKAYYFSRLGSLVSHNHPALVVWEYVK